MTDDVSIRVERGIGRITLTRPSALHALNTPMCAAVLACSSCFSAPHTSSIRRFRCSCRWLLGARCSDVYKFSIYKSLPGRTF